MLSDRPRGDVPAVPAHPIRVQSLLGGGVRVRPVNDLQASFELVASWLMAPHPDDFGKKYPDLLQWNATVDVERLKAKG